MFGEARENGYVTPAMAEPGNSIIMTKGAGVEAAAYLAWSFRDEVERKLGQRAASRARKMIGLCSTVDDSVAASRAGLGRGGVTSMHDATEGGVLGGLEEMALASHSAFVVNRARVPVPEDARAVCETYGLDPLSAVSEGALLLTCSAEAEDRVVVSLRASGVLGTVIGRVQKGAGLFSSDRRGRKGKRIWSKGSADYWNVFARKRLGH